MDAIAKMKKSFESIDTTLSCLSCLEYLQEPLTLVCGHSICLKVLILQLILISVSKRIQILKVRILLCFAKNVRLKQRIKT